MELMLPSRHIHPGIPYDLYDGYIVVQSQQLEGENQNFQQQQNTIVLGQLPSAVRIKLEQQRGRYQYVHNNKVIMKMNIVKLLNLLGSMDYRVIDTSSPDKKHVIWT